MDAADHLSATRRALLVAVTICLGLVVTCIVLARRTSTSAAGEGANPLDDPAVRRAAIAELVTKGLGWWDTFPDPEVGRILQPSITTRTYDKVKLTTNTFGIRERQFDVPKTAGTIRVVVLGDSFVLGQGIEAEDRLGAFLNGYFLKFAATGHDVECLNIGMTCWNVVAETSFVKRCFSLLQPDLVIQLLIRNDLEDNPGARGFGSIGFYDPLHGERGEPIFQAHTPADVFGTRKWSWIEAGLDYESRSRFEDAARRVKRFASLIEAAGGRYLLVDFYTDHMAASRKFLTSQLRPEQVCYITSDLAHADDYKVDKIHWNRAGNELVSKMLYWVIRERKLLPRLDLKEWPEATEIAKSWLPRGEAEAAVDFDTEELPSKRAIRKSINFAKLDDDTAAQVTGGVRRDGSAGPYVSLILAADGARRVKVAGHGLKRLELDGTQVEVFADEVKVGSFEVKGGDPIQFEAAIPEEVGKRKFLSVRFISNEFAYAADDLREHVVFLLERVTLN